MADIVIAFKGESFTIPETRAFEAAEAIERWYADRFPGQSALFALVDQSRAPSFTVIAHCIAILLRVAGTAVKPDEVWREMMERQKGGESTVHLAPVLALVAVLMDGAPAAKGGGEPEKTDAS